MSIREFLFGRSTCAGCGRPLEDWVEFRVHHGYNEEMLWRGCPEYREARQRADLPGMDRHTAWWNIGARTPLVLA